MPDDVGELSEPEQRELRQHHALVGDAGGQHHVEGADPIRGHDEQPVTEVVDVPDLAAAPHLQVRQARLEQWRRRAEMGG
jgi:hypothetical protein